MKITLNIPTVYECEGVVLVAGENEVDNNAAAKMLKNPMVQADVKSGKLTVEKAAKITKAAAKKIAANEAKAAQDAADEAELVRLQAEEDAKAAAAEASE